MADYLKKITSAQNIVTSAIDTSVPSAFTLSPGRPGKDWEFSGPKGKRCKVVIACNEAQNLIDQMRKAKEGPETIFGNIINPLITTIQSAANDLNITNFTTYMDNFKKYQGAYIKAKTDRDNALKKPIVNLSIPVRVFVKGVAGKQDGHIKTINIANKSVDVEYKYDKIDSTGNKQTVTEKLIDIEIKNLCIVGEKGGQPCVIEVGQVSPTQPKVKQDGGAAKYLDKVNEDDKSYKFICE